jgi:hypothetical protein
MGFSKQLHVLRSRVQSTASLRAMKKFYHDGNITIAVADWKAPRTSFATLSFSTK